MDSFETSYHELDFQFVKIGVKMLAVYAEAMKSGDDQMLSKRILALGKIARDVLNFQRELVRQNASPDVEELFISQIAEKEAKLEEILELFGKENSI